MAILESGGTSLKFKNKLEKRSDVDVMALKSWTMSDYFSMLCVNLKYVMDMYILF